MSFLNFLKDIYQTDDSFDFNHIQKITPEWIIYIIGILDFSVKSLKFARNINNNFLTDILLALVANPFMQLETLDLSYNEISDELLITLVNLLINNRVFVNLKSLILYGNKIGDIGAKALSTYLASNTTLISLNLNNNRIGNSGVIDINLALETNHTIRDLYLSKNQYDSVGATSFGYLISRNKNISSLSISYTDVSDANNISNSEVVTNNIAYALTKNSTLKKFILNNSNMSLADNDAFAFAVQKNKALLCCKINDKTVYIDYLNRNKIIWENHYWSRQRHLEFVDYPYKYFNQLIFNKYEDTFHSMITSTLLCGSEFNIYLPPEMWEYIFSFFQRKNIMVSI